MLTNGIISVEFDIKNKSFSVNDARRKEPLLSGVKIDIKMEENSELRILRKEKIEDAMGKGKRVILALLDNGLFRYDGCRNRTPERLFSFTLYKNNPALVLGFGMQMPPYFSMRLKESTVLSGGELFGGKEICDPLTLNGGAGAAQTLVRSELSRMSCNSLMLTGLVEGKRRTAVWGGLGNRAFAKIATLKDGIPGLFAEDPIGVLIDKDQEFLAEDTFYIDLVTEEPFEALEKYGVAMRLANNAAPQVYEFPVVCGWSVGFISKLPDINNSAKLVEEAEHANECGLTKYTKVSLRLEPDKYHNNTEQGWWDDEHFRKYKHLVKPYDTMAGWCSEMKDRNAVPYTYMQLGMPSDDFAKAYPQYMIFNDASEVNRVAPNAPGKRKHHHHMPYVTYDYTDKEFSKHFLKVWSDIRKAGVRGVKVDYPATAWRPEGGFDDRYASTCSAYRRAFELLRKAMGKKGLIDERNLGETARPCLDITAGLVDTQRTWGDSNKFVPEMISRSGLRWYKNRTVFNYYSDTKSLHDHSEGKLQSLITMNFLTSGRLDLATSFSLFTPEITHIVSRSYPHYTEAICARPLDAFTGVKDPQVYDLELTPDWHQVTFYNTGKKTAKIATSISGERVNNSVGLDAASEYHAYEFWSDKYLGKLQGTDKIAIKLKKEHCAMISLRKVKGNPQVISTDRHLLQGWVDLNDISWDPKNKQLSGKAKTIAGEPFKITIAGNGCKAISAETKGALVELRPYKEGDLSEVIITSKTNKNVVWKVKYE